MSATQLWLLLRSHAAHDRSTSARFTSVLAIIAFAATSAVSLVVVGGLMAFIGRQQAGLKVGDIDPMFYVVLAGFAVLLLLVPLTTLGAAAARLAMARRDARLAALRLAGATTWQVSVITLLDAGLQALIGSLIGVAGPGGGELLVGVGGDGTRDRGGEVQPPLSSFGPPPRGGRGRWSTARRSDGAETREPADIRTTNALRRPDPRGSPPPWRGRDREGGLGDGG
jgi:hypothetical protein